MKFEIKHRFNGSILFSIETTTWKLAVEAAIKSSADLRSADLSSADLRSADLRYADLRYANLRSADLRYADLRYANLSSADLSSADLRYANLRSAGLRYADLRSADLSSADLRLTIVQIAGIGTARRMTTYCADYDKVWCGCFTGTLKEFSARCLETHRCHTKYLAEYKAAIAFFKSIEKLYEKNR
jgi:hypothetical protein